MSKFFTYNKLPEHQVAIYHDADEKHESEARPMECTLLNYLVVGFASILVIFTFPVSLWFCVKVIRDYERAVVFRLGRLLPAKGPGVIFVIPCLDAWSKIDMRTRAFSVPPQQIPTSDEGIVTVGAEVQFFIYDPVLSKTNVQDLNHALRMIAQTTLTNSLTTKTVAGIQADRRFITLHVQDVVNKVASQWGVKVDRVEFSEILVVKDPNNPNANRNALPFPVPGVGSGSENGVDVSKSNMFGHPALASLFAGLGGQKSKPLVPASASSSSCPKLLTPKELVQLLRGVLDEALVRRVGGTFQFNILGDSGGTWFMDLKTGSGRITDAEKPLADPDVIMTMSTADMQKIFYGQLTAFNAYMQGSLKIDGDLKKAMTLESLVNKLKEKPVPSAGQTSSGICVV